MKMSDVKKIIAEELQNMNFSEKDEYDSLATVLNDLLFASDRQKIDYEELKKASKEMKEDQPEMWDNLDQGLRLFLKYMVRKGKLEEETPPGREDQVKALKKELPKTYTDKSGKVQKSNPWAVAWASYKKDKGLNEIQGIVQEMLKKHGYMK